jgi:hypothetical protein
MRGSDRLFDITQPLSMSLPTQSGIEQMAAYPDPKPSADERPEPIMETNASDQQSSSD